MAEQLMGEETRICCEGFSRSQALRRALASGRPRARPEWDPRMPTPAGAGIDRRRFLLGAAGGLVSVYGADRLGLTSRVLAEGIAQAATVPNPVLVSVFLQGGIDALSMLAPAGDPLYQQLRPTLAVAPTAGTPFTEDPRLRWHPAAASFAQLHDAGKVTVLPGIGYSTPDMSHFTSRHFWEVGATQTELVTGWLGRYLDVAGSPTNPLQGLSMDGEMSPTLATAHNPVAAIDRPYDFSLWLNGVWGDVFAWTLDAAAALGDAQHRSSDPALAQVAQAASEVGVVRRTLAPFRDANGNPAYISPVTYPTGTSDFPQRLAGLAAMIAAGVPVRCVALTSDSQFDTHAAQAQTFSSGLSLVADSLAAFQADLEARGVADRVLVHVWSEFGRRAQENGSNGTDHGAAGASLLIGTPATGTMVGEWPGLTSLDVNGNQIENVDYRGVYCSLLEQWFSEDAAAVIPGAAQFTRYPLIK
ncbi:MAG TPA: DUF1501 domain-containing protein [Solirubrobacteraceae bacterium]|jgi:uncharacterized protein (DUF1501 family)|nr:DUF1501 domain-containing protein [Solirubrobacteraceae bacterium]